jgi:hypothetical protein
MPKLLVRFLALSPLLAAMPAVATAAIFTGDITYTRFADTARVRKVSVTYDDVADTFVLGVPVTIAGTSAPLGSMAGADGIAFDPNNGHILVGAQTSIVHRINPVGPVVSSASTGPVAAFHLAVDPAGTHVYASGIPGGISRVPIGGAFGAAGTTFTVAGSTTAVTQIIFTPGLTYYTASGPGGVGQFGTIVLTPGPNTAVTTALFFSVPAAHGGTYDPFTGDVFIFGDDHITQFDPITSTFVSDLDLSAVGISVADLDQGTVDGLGHAYVADNGGKLVFVDYSTTGLIGAGANFRAAPFLDTFLDDVAPLVGPGSIPGAVPEPLSIVLWSGMSVLGLAWQVRRRRQA